jgi:hypothetical protein
LSHFGTKKGDKNTNNSAQTLIVIRKEIRKDYRGRRKQERIKSELEDRKWQKG